VSLQDQFLIGRFHLLLDLRPEELKRSALIFLALAVPPFLVDWQPVELEIPLPFLLERMTQQHFPHLVYLERGLLLKQAQAK